MGPESQKQTDWSYLDEMTGGTAVFDFDERYLYLNDIAVQQTGKRKEELLGKTIKEVFPDAKQQEIYPYFKKSLENRITTQVEMPYHFENGTTRWFEYRMEPIPEGVLVISIDITDFKKLQSETK